MNGHLSQSMQQRLNLLDRQIRRRAALVGFGYSFGLLGAITLYLFFPFQLSRIGSVLLMIALAHMICKVCAASRDARRAEPDNPLLKDLSKLDAQIRLIQSAIYNLPFVVGANLFFMGLPGTGSAESKAWLDCCFLLGTVIIFSAFYVLNQQTVRKELLPLRQELEAFVCQSSQ